MRGQQANLREGKTATADLENRLIEYEARQIKERLHDLRAIYI